MLKTPTYDVFHMYRYHQGASLLESAVTGSREIGPEDSKVPQITESVSEKDGVITVTVNNLSMTEGAELSLSFSEDKTYEVVEARILVSGDVHDHNTFDAPDVVREKDYDGYKAEGKGFVLELPAASVVMMRFR